MRFSAASVLLLTVAAAALASAQKRRFFPESARRELDKQSEGKRRFFPASAQRALDRLRNDEKRSLIYDPMLADEMALLYDDLDKRSNSFNYPNYLRFGKRQLGGMFYLVDPLLDEQLDDWNGDKRSEGPQLWKGRFGKRAPPSQWTVRFGKRPALSTGARRQVLRNELRLGRRAGGRSFPLKRRGPLFVRVLTDPAKKYKSDSILQQIRLG